MSKAERQSPLSRRLPTVLGDETPKDRGYDGWLPMKLYPQAKKPFPCLVPWHDAASSVGPWQRAEAFLLPPCPPFPHPPT